MSQLKRCPCCNGEDIVTGDKAYGFGTDIYIRCRTCGLKMQICSEFGWEELFKRWNTRKQMERIIERLEEYEGTYVDVDIVRGIIKEEGEMNE